MKPGTMIELGWVLDITMEQSMPSKHQHKPTQLHVASTAMLVLRHCWCLDRDAIRADVNVSREYKRLAKRRLTPSRIEAAPRRSTPPLPRRFHACL